MYEIHVDHSKWNYRYLCYTVSVLWHYVSVVSMTELNQYFNRLNRQSIRKRKELKETNLSPPLRALHGSAVIMLAEIPPNLL